MSTTSMTNGQTTHVNTSGGAAIGQDVNIDRGDFVNRDKHEHHHYHYDSTLPSPSTMTTKARGIFGLYPFNQNFFGRDEELASLHNLLQAQTNVAICPVITGMGGLGKTQLAAHYARNHVDDYPAGIFWITAANLNDIRPQLADFCVALGLPVADPQRSGDLSEQKITALKHYLDSHPQALLIFDNVEEPDHLRTRQIGVQLTALTLGGKVIVTTRRRKLPDDKFAELALQRLLPEPARQILIATRADLVDDPDLDPLCAQSGYLPLMLKLAAAALKKRGGVIAGYLQRLRTLGAEKLHNEVAKVSLDDYHKSLTVVLHEQWTMLRDENARILLRVAGQLPEAAVIPTARLGLLAGLSDVDEWECSLSDALDELERASLIERVDSDTLRLHPLVRDFAEGITPINERDLFLENCAQRMADAYSDFHVLELEFRQRGVGAIIMDLIVALALIQNCSTENVSRFQERLALLQQLIRRESHKCLSSAPPNFTLWRQLLYRANPFQQEKLLNDNKMALHLPIHLRSCWMVQDEFLGVNHGIEKDDNEFIVSVAVLDEKHIAYLSSERIIRIWNLYTNTLEQMLKLPRHVSNIIALDKNHIAFAGYTNMLNIWDLLIGQVDELFNFGHRVYCLTLLDTNHIITVEDEIFEVWNLKTGHAELTFNMHENDERVYSLTTLDQNRIISGSDIGILRIWNLNTMEVEQTLSHISMDTSPLVVLDSDRIISDFDSGVFKI